MTRPHYTHYVARDNGGVRACYSVNRDVVAGQLARILASVTRAGDRKVRRGDLVRLVVYGVRRQVTRRSGTTVHLGYNGVVNLKKDGTPVATRVYGPVYLEARHAGYSRLAVVSRGTL